MAVRLIALGLELRGEHEPWPPSDFSGRGGRCGMNIGMPPETSGWAAIIGWRAMIALSPLRALVGPDKQGLEPGRRRGGRIEEGVCGASPKPLVAGVPAAVSGGGGSGARAFERGVRGITEYAVERVALGRGGAGISRAANQRLLTAWCQEMPPNSSFPPSPHRTDARRRDSAPSAASTPAPRRYARGRRRRPCRCPSRAKTCVSEPVGSMTETSASHARARQHEMLGADAVDGRAAVAARGAAFSGKVDAALRLEARRRRSSGSCP